MNLKYNYWFFKNALTDKNCSDIIQLGKSKQLEIAVTGAQTKIIKKKNVNELTKKEIKDLKKVRNSEVLFLNDPWLYNLITPYVRQANNASGWNYDITWNESFQFTSYKKNQHYSWHQDGHEEPYKSTDPNFNNKIRKISVICSLTDSKEYQGGKVEIYNPNPNNKKIVSHEIKELKTKGTIVVFPSFIWHRVSPVTKGHRNSLVMWAIGPSFK